LFNPSNVSECCNMNNIFYKSILNLLKKLLGIFGSFKLKF